MKIPENKTIIYVTRDAERASGLPMDTSGYEVITNDSPTKEILDTWQLLEKQETKDIINSKENPQILVFKNTKKIEGICADNNWTLLNPSVELADKVEEKISQVEWLGELKKYLPETKIMLGEELEWNNEKYIVQYNRAHTGSGTTLIKTQEGVNTIKKDFPKRPVRVSKYITGPVLTTNAVVTKEKIFTGNISYQITGLSPFTDNEFATIGNDWNIADSLLDERQKDKFNKIVREIGEKLKREGWRGLFGVDIILDNETKDLFLIEINARQPASTSLESKLQKNNTVFEAHINALLDEKVEVNTQIPNGAQVILRNQTSKTYDLARISKELEDLGLWITQYNNTKPGSDLLRIQTTESMVGNHNEFNDLGKQIADICQ